MATLATIRDFVREQTLLETADWASAKLDAVINEGYNELCSAFDWPFLAVSNDFDTVATTQSYALATVAPNVARISAIIDLDKRLRLEEIDPHSAWSAFGGDMPDGAATKFFIWGSDLYLIPVPDTSETDGFRIFYYKQPTLLTGDASVPQWDAQFHMALAFYACSKAWEREEDFEKAQQWRGQYDKRVEAMARFYLNRAADQPTVFGLGRSPKRRGGDLNLPLA